MNPRTTALLVLALAICGAAIAAPVASADTWIAVDTDGDGYCQEDERIVTLPVGNGWACVYG